MSAKKALVTGITGQDGSYLAELLLDKGYEVHGLIRRSSSFSTGRIDHLYRDPHEPDVRLFLHYSRPDRLLVARSPGSTGSSPTRSTTWAPRATSGVSFELPEFTADTAAMGTLRLLEAIRHADWPVRFYQAGSSEMFGKVAESPQRETTPFYPRSPYAVAKVFAHQMTIQYREAYGLFAVERDPLQPRVAAPGRDVRDAQGHPRHRRHPGRAGRRSSTSATSTRGATGATRPSTSRRCG